jgi:hypothetical protein
VAFFNKNKKGEVQDELDELDEYGVNPEDKLDDE